MDTIIIYDDGDNNNDELDTKDQTSVSKMCTVTGLHYTNTTIM